MQTLASRRPANADRLQRHRPTTAPENAQHLEQLQEGIAEPIHFCSSCVFHHRSSIIDQPFCSTSFSLAVVDDIKELRNLFSSRLCLGVVFAELVGVRNLCLLVWHIR